MDGYGSDFDETKAEGGPVSDVLGVFIKSGGETDGVGEGAAEEGLIEAGIDDLIASPKAWAQDGHAGCQTQRRRPEAMCLLRVEAE